MLCHPGGEDCILGGGSCIPEDNVCLVHSTNIEKIIHFRPLFSFILASFILTTPD